MTRCALLMTVVTLLFPAAAHAAYSYPGQTPLPPMLDRVVGAADAFWIRHDGRDACPQGIAEWQAPSLMDSDAVDANGRGADCQVWIKGWLVHLAFNPRTWRNDLTTTCADIFHEDGHARGHVAHTARGIMSIAPGVRPPRWCVTWGRATMREFLRGRGLTEHQVAKRVY